MSGVDPGLDGCRAVGLADEVDHSGTPALLVAVPLDHQAGPGPGPVAGPCHPAVPAARSSTDGVAVGLVPTGLAPTRLAPTGLAGLRAAPGFLLGTVGMADATCSGRDTALCQRGTAAPAHASRRHETSLPHGRTCVRVGRRRGPTEVESFTKGR